MPGADGTSWYRPVAKLLHWLTALLVLGMLGVGLWMVGLPISLTKLYVYAWHKWIGLTVLVLTVLRLLWRTYSPPPSLPDEASVVNVIEQASDTPASERALAFGGEQLLLQHRALFDLLEARAEARRDF